METAKEKLRKKFDKEFFDKNGDFDSNQDWLFEWIWKEIEAREAQVKDWREKAQFFTANTTQEVRDQIAIVQGSNREYADKISRLESTLEAAKIACEIVVNGYKVDGFENMQPRDHVFYKHCEQALINQQKQSNVNQQSPNS